MFGTAFFWGVSGEYTAYFLMTEALFCNDSVAANFLARPVTRNAVWRYA